MRLLGALSAAISTFVVVGYYTGHLRSMRLRGKRNNKLSRQAWLAQAGAPVTPAQFVGLSVACGVVALALGWAVSGSVAIGIVPAIAAGFAPRTWYARHRKARLHSVITAWPDGILHVLGALRNGLAIHAAIVDLVATGPEPLQAAFRHYEAWARVSNPNAALVRVREQLAEPISDKAIGVLIEANRHGTEVALRILDRLAEDVRADERVSAQIRAAQQEPRINGAVAFGFPWLALLLSCATSSEVRDFYGTHAGRVALAIAALISLTNLAFIARLAREAPEPRVVGEQ